MPLCVKLRVETLGNYNPLYDICGLLYKMSVILGLHQNHISENRVEFWTLV
jgi:hypothetical protein